MTVCIAAKTESGIWLATDSLVSGGGGKDYGGPKWFESGGIIVAYAGPGEYDTRLRGELDLDYNYHGEGLLRYMESEYLPKARDIFDDPEDMPELMAVYSGQIVVVSGGAAYETERTYAAIGIGGPVALGAYAALSANTDLSVEDKLRKSVMAAVEHCEDCGGETRLRWQPS